jgi:hypothetical protein
VPPERGLDLAHQRRDLVQHPRPLRGQHDAAAHALRQLRSHPILERRDALAHRGLRDAQPRRGQARGAGVAQRPERLELLEHSRDRT